MNGRKVENWYPWTKFLTTPVVVNFATLGPIGTRLKAPGTWGSVAGVLWYTVAFHFASPIGYLFLLAL